MRQLSDILEEYEFLDADDRPIAVKSGATRMRWEYDLDGACVRRTSFAVHGDVLAVDPCA